MKNKKEKQSARKYTSFFTGGENCGRLKDRSSGLQTGRNEFYRQEGMRDTTSERRSGHVHISELCNCSKTYSQNNHPLSPNKGLDMRRPWINKGQLNRSPIVDEMSVFMIKNFKSGKKTESQRSSLPFKFLLLYVLINSIF